MHISRHLDASKGFSLIEISIVLVIVATILSSVLPTITEGTKIQAIEETTDRMKAIEDAIQAYYATNVTIPCPAPINAAVNTAAFGVEDSGATCQAGAAATRYGASGNVVGGAVPTKTLGLPDDYAFDGWGRRIAYHVDHRATQTATFGTAGGITVNGDTGTRTTVGVYALISSGRNGHGGYTRGGLSFNGGSTNAHELENCELGSAPCAGAYDTTLVQKMEKSDDVADPTDRFDDIVIYKLLGHITGGGSSDTLWTQAGANIYNTNTGNVGVGITTPTEKLQVMGGNIAATNATGSSIISTNTSLNGGVAQFYLGNTGPGGANWAINAGNTATGTLGARLGIAEGSTYRMVIEQGGNVGIGLTDPSSPLEVYGPSDVARINGPAAATNPYLSIASNNVRQGYIGWGVPNTNMFVTSDFALSLGSGSAERVRILSDGTIGIGTTVPGATQLNVTSGLSTHHAGYFRNLSGGNSLYSETAGTGIPIHGRALGAVNASSAIVGEALGTGAAFHGRSRANHAVYGELSPPTSSYYGAFGLNGIYWAGLGRSDGYSIVGNGNAWFNGTFYASDERLKENISDMQGSLAKVLAMHAVQYTWKKDAEQARLAGETVQYGVIAQEMEKIAPEAVTTMKVPRMSASMMPPSVGPDGKPMEAIQRKPTLNEELGETKGVDYSKLVPHLIGAVQELNAKVDAQPHSTDSSSSTASAQSNDKTAKLMKAVQALNAKVDALEDGKSAAALNPAAASESSLALQQLPHWLLVALVAPWFAIGLMAWRMRRRA